MAERLTDQRRLGANVFLNSPGLGVRSLAAEASLELDFNFGPPGVERSLEAEISLGEEVLPDMLRSCQDSFFCALFSLWGELLGVVLLLTFHTLSVSELG